MPNGGLAQDAKAVSTIAALQLHVDDGDDLILKVLPLDFMKICTKLM